MHELRVVRERRVGYSTPRTPLRDSATVVAAFRDHFAALDREQFVVILLDGKNRVLGFNVVSVGTLNASIVHPREVFKSAIISNAAAMILVHNHPSGDPVPSAEDRAITQRLVAAGNLLGIRVLDHVVVGDDGRHFSFNDAGQLGDA